MKVLLINGASGSGKTTLAEALVERLQHLAWVHPDGLMDTTKMAAEEILSASLSQAISQYPDSTVLIDCQIRPSSIHTLVPDHLASDWEMVLLDCPRATREERLLKRGWTTEDFDRVDRWARILREETESCGCAIFDTSTCSVGSIADELQRR